MKSYLFIGGPADNKVIGLEDTTTVVDIPVVNGPMLIPPGEAAAYVRSKSIEPEIAHYERREIGFGFYVFAPREWTPPEVMRALLSGYRGEFRSDLPGGVKW